MGWESTEQTQLGRLATVVDSGAAGNVSLADVCSHVKLTVTPRTEPGIGFRGAGGGRNRHFGEMKFKFRVSDGHVELMPVAKIVAAGNRVHPDRNDSWIVKPKGDASICGSGRTRLAGGWVFTGWSRSLRHR